MNNNEKRELLEFRNKEWKYFQHVQIQNGAAYLNLLEHTNTWIYFTSTTTVCPEVYKLCSLPLKKNL